MGSGWKYVPIDPNPDMMRAAFEACKLNQPDWLAIRFRAMVYAAPSVERERISEDEIMSVYRKALKESPRPEDIVGLIDFAREIEYLTMQNYLP